MKLGMSFSFSWCARKSNGIADWVAQAMCEKRRWTVASPAREHLEMVGVTEILDKLMNICIEMCDQLLYVFPSQMLPLNLQYLEIANCDELEVIFSTDPKEEKEAINDDVIVFPRLKRVSLWYLPKLKSFYSETQGFFSHKVQRSLPFFT
ncbi:hypothetical protein RHSIM_Rhsim03G0017200 [Rhododendron simsii]|uniref:Disease resistance protein At4g27190-like leucine-rich repeats domain-containing protein n=1 Tax=Rhododendron simsii TaxID=118357 RepID=A0A834LSW4_RHOSS|nr:hypothetical protein RHSIM_Rhsim03G0017200 [Rhododendron simsii]